MQEMQARMLEREGRVVEQAVHADSARVLEELSALRAEVRTLNARLVRQDA